MKLFPWCKEHWDLLRAYIERKGMTKFVPTDGTEAARRMQSDGNGVGDFDPLMGSWMRINSTMAESPGLRGRFDQCPCCILIADGQPKTVDNWLDGVTTDALNFAIEQGWIPKQ